MLDGFVAAWWPSKEASVAPTTAREYRRLLDRVILPSLGKRPLQKISGSELSAILAQIVQRDARTMAEHVYVMMRILFNAAVKQGALGKSPLDGVERPRASRREMTVLSPDDWQRVLAYLQNHSSWALAPLTVLITTGLRRSELCGLRWGDVDFDRSLVLVQRSFHLIGGQPVYSAPKTVRSRRAVALDGATVGLLERHREDLKRSMELFGRRIRTTDAVFGRPDGSPFPPDTYSGLWARIREALGISIRLHDLRHSSATMLLAAGVPIQLVSARLGHSTAGFTLSTYAHSLPGQQEAAAEALSKMLSNGKSDALSLATD
jgi:integrase